MGSLKHCLSINSTPAPIAKKINALQKQYVSEGHSGAEATSRAVQDTLGETTKQRADIISQINNQISEKHPDMLPTQEHEAFEKVRAETGEDTIQQVEDNSDAGRTVQAMAKKFGKKIVFFKGSRKANGFFRRSYPDTLFVNVNNNKNKVMFTFGHELLHALKNDDHKLYLKLFKSMYNHVNDFDAFFEKENANRVKQKLGELTEVEMAEEFFGDFTGEQFTDKAFWQQLAEDDPTTFQKLAELFQQVFDQIIGSVSQKHVRALTKAQTTLAGVMNEYAKKSEVEVDLQATLDAGTTALSVKYPEIRKDVAMFSLKTFASNSETALISSEIAPDGYY
jgi:Zn-dependent peptidase ImmA (M78 family)